MKHKQNKAITVEKKGKGCEKSENSCDCDCKCECEHHMQMVKENKYLL